eukprot:SAG11_NODE_2192_length_3701_cov_5.319367_1_plen_47_part_00
MHAGTYYPVIMLVANTTRYQDKTQAGGNNKITISTKALVKVLGTFD